MFGMRTASGRLSKRELSAKVWPNIADIVSIGFGIAGGILLA